MAFNITNSFLIFIFVVFYTFSLPLADTTPSIVHLISKMDNGTEPVKIKCKVDGKIGADLTLKSGQDLPFKVIVNDTYACAAIWGLKIASIDAFEPKRDKGYPIMYWRVAKDGFYLSWNKIDFKFIAGWDSE
ncbi:hypothetical protein RND71_025970 [Anisodus tanguticus]|uniref:Leguminosin group486 secreted peptide n=1 Tax=Anisodus tanguticus TaxID=243964 RepID=A0AAE1RLE4_9SOLA|nr:hypothetical protein RND71_025970 [Anisodus tanguticus]